jgi:two-component system, OmpR family, sensor kinase
MECPPVAPTVSSATLEELQHQLAELTEAVAARDAFIAVAAHELRNPMTPIIGHIELLLTGIRNGRYTPKQVEQRLERIQVVMNHYLKRTVTLLDISRMTSGKRKIEPMACDLSEVVREIVRAFAEASRHAGSAIGVRAPANLFGTWDRLALEQIIENLLSNAIKYGGNGPIEISVDDHDRIVCIRVRDHGPGISHNDRKRIFARFERAVGISEQQSGFGVGLWIVGQLVESMEGSIEVGDAPDGGAMFTVTLPRHIRNTHG